MILAKVVATVTATQKHKSFLGKTLFAVIEVGNDGKKMNKEFLAFDSVGAGIGDIVLCAQEGNTARDLLGTKKDPFHSVVLAIVDKVSRT